MGMNGKIWYVFDNWLFFGGVDGKVYEVDCGYDDVGELIIVVVVLVWIWLFDGWLVVVKFIWLIFLGNV